jgi:two-component system, NarL family, response regulator NreC
MVDDFVFWHTFLVRTFFDNRPALEILGAAHSGLEAAQKAADLQLDLVLLDISLPDKNGTQAAEQLRQRVPKSKTIFVTIESEHEIVRAAFRGVDILEWTRQKI